MNEVSGVIVGTTEDSRVFILINTVYEEKPLQTMAQMPPDEAMRLAEILVQTCKNITGWGGKDVRNSPDLN